MCVRRQEEAVNERSCERTLFYTTLILNCSKLGCKNEEAELKENHCCGLAGML